MAEIHPTAIVDPQAELADDVVVGPHCVLSGRVRVASGTRIIGNAYLEGPVTLGRDNLVYPFVTLGFAPQDFKWKPSEPGAGLRIGDGNVFREGVAIHRATSAETPTTIGDRNYWMAYSHAGHDCRIGSHCVFANGALLGGTVTVGDGVIVGGNAAVHQFCQVGRGAMLSGCCGLPRDLPPFFMLTGQAVAGSINLVGMRRAKMSSEEIGDVKWVYRTLYRRGLPFKRALDEIRTRSDRPLVAEYVAFLEASERGVVRGWADPRRGAADS